MPELIGVTGATGQVGGRVAQRLAERGLRQRLIVRDASRAPELHGAQVAEMAGFHDRPSVHAAVEGVDTLLLVPAEEAQDRIEQHRTAVDAAEAAGVRRIVYLSYLGAATDSTFTLGRHHWATEEHIRSKNVAFTFPRMSLYMDFMPLMVGADGAIRGPGDDGRLAPVLRDDLADVLAAILADPTPHDGMTYGVTGPESLTLAEMAETMADATGHDIHFVDETIEEAWESRRRTGAPDWEIEGWISSYVAVASGELDVVTDAVEQIAGHEPVSLGEYLREHPEALGHVEG